MYNDTLTRTLKILLLVFLVIAALYYGREFLIPLSFGGLLAMLFLPFSRWMESKGLGRGVAALICVLTLVFILAGLIWLITWQVSDLASDVTNMERKVQQLISNFQNSIKKNLGISVKQQDKMISGEGGGSQAAGIIAGVAGSVMGMVVNLILVWVYIFLFLFFRRHLKRFTLLLVPADSKENAQQILQDTQKVSQQYLTGVGAMIACLWIMYSIGFSIVGVKNAIFFAILCGLLEIVPFVGNLAGNLLTILMAFTQGGGMDMVVGILITYATVQFIQSYLLEPLVVGSEVNINPLFTIIALVVGELVWGIGGMVLAIPILGIVKIICDHVEPLKPYGFLIGENKKKKEGGWSQKVKGWFK